MILNIMLFSFLFDWYYKMVSPQNGDTRGSRPPIDATDYTQWEFCSIYSLFKCWTSSREAVNTRFYSHWFDLFKKQTWVDSFVVAQNVITYQQFLFPLWSSESICNYTGYFYSKRQWQGIESLGEWRELIRFYPPKFHCRRNKAYLQPGTYLSLNGPPGRV